MITSEFFTPPRHLCRALTRTRQIFAGGATTLAMALAALAAPWSALAQPYATNTAVLSGLNPSKVGSSVTFTAAVSGPSTLAPVTLAAGFGVSVAQTEYFRYDLTGATFNYTVSGASLVDTTTPANLATAVAVQGGLPGDAYVVFQVTAGGAGIQGTDQLTLTLGSLNTLSSTRQITYSVHGTAGSAAGPTPSNVSRVYLAAPVTLVVTPVGPGLTGTVSFADNSITITGCGAVAISAGAATCAATIATAGVHTITANYSGDANYLPSSGSLAGGQTVNLAVSPATLPAATYGFAITPVTFVASGGTAPYVFAIVSGAPPGISLSSSGVLTGTPTAVGTFSMNISVTSANNLTSSITIPLLVIKAPQTITFSLPANGVIGTMLTLSATSNSGLAVSYAVTTPLTCSITGNTLTLLAGGGCTVVASQTGNANYNAAANVSVTVSVTTVTVSGPASILLRLPGGPLQQGTLVNSAFQFSALPALPAGSELTAWTDLNNNGVRDLVFQKTILGDLAEVRVWPDMNPANEIFLRNVRTVWQVQALGDLDGDGFGDLVWRYNVDGSADTGVSYVWFTNGSGVTQVSKRGGAPLNWLLLGAADLNGDRAADMVYLAPDGGLRVLMATANRSCANLSAGTVPADFTARKFANFSGSGRGDLLIHNIATGELRLISLDATGLALPAPTAVPGDPNASCTASTLSVRTTTTSVGFISPGYLYYASGDFNGDGITDFAFLGPGNSLLVVLMAANGAAPTVLQNAGTAPAGYQVFQP